MDIKLNKFGYLLGIFAGILLILLGFCITPNLVAKNLSPDGILEPSTISDINTIRLGAVVAGILILLFRIAPDSLLRIFQNNYAFLGLIFLLFSIFLPSGGHTDINVFAYWSNFVYEHGIANTYKASVNYHPINIYLFYIVGLYQKYFGSIPDTYNILKLIVLLFDMWGIWLITRFAPHKRHFKIILFSFINIAFWYNTIIWGQIDSIFSTLAFASVYMAIKGNIKAALILMLLSINFKLQAIIFVPIILIFSLPYFFKAFHLKKIIIVLASLIIVQLVIIFPFWLNQGLGQVQDVMTRAVGYYPMVSMNAYNFWDLIFEGNAMAIKDNIVVNGLSYRNWGLLIFFATSSIALAPLLIITFRKRHDEIILYSDHQDSLNIIFLSCGLIPLLFFFFNTQMHERYSHSALLFIFAFSYINKKYFPLLLFSIAYFLNLDGVLREFYFLKIIGETFIRNHSLIATCYAILILYMFFYLYKIGIKRERILSKLSANPSEEHGSKKP